VFVRTFDPHVVAARPVPVARATEEHIPKYLGTRLRRDVVRLVGIHPYATNDPSVSAWYAREKMKSIIGESFD
jgi:hypothetical protein